MPDFETNAEGGASRAGRTFGGVKQPKPHTRGITVNPRVVQTIKEALYSSPSPDIMYFTIP